MSSPESKLSGWEKTKRVVKASAVCAALGTGACSSPSPDPEAQTPLTTATSTTRESAPVTREEDKVWGKALRDLSEKIEAGEPVTLLVPDKPLCVYWPSMVDGAYTVQRNPVMYAYNEGDISLSFLPFVSRNKDVPPQVMNGPYQSQRLDENNQPIPGSALAYGNVTFPNDQMYLFTEETIQITLMQEEPADVFTSGWMQGPDGTRYAETKVVPEEDLATIFPDCEIMPPKPDMPSDGQYT